MSEPTEAAKILAEEHWAWLESLLHKVYVDAMIHGFRHGAEWQRNKGGGETDISKVDLVV